MMTQKERLVELLYEADNEAFNAIYVSFEEYYSQLADYLLNNGVIVPPCKVGDRAWFVDYSGKKIFECEIESITFDAFNDSLVIKCLNRPYLRLTIEIARMQIAVFFTREEAEKALKERGKE